MGHAVQGTLVLAPSAAPDADQAVVGPLDDLHQVVRESKDGQQVGGGRGPETEVPHVRVVGDDRVEVAVDVGGGELSKRPRVDSHLLQDGVQAREEVRADVPEEHVGGARPAVRGGDGGQASHLERRRADSRDEVSSVQPAHAVRDDVDGPSCGVPGDLFGQGRRAGLDRPRPWHRRRDTFDPVARESLLDPPPVLDAGEVRPGESPLVETQKAVCQDDGVSRCRVVSFERRIVALDQAAEVGKPGVDGFFFVARRRRVVFCGARTLGVTAGRRG